MESQGVCYELPDGRRVTVPATYSYVRVVTTVKPGSTSFTYKLQGSVTVEEHHEEQHPRWWGRLFGLKKTVITTHEEYVDIPQTAFEGALSK